MCIATLPCNISPCLAGLLSLRDTAPCRLFYCAAEYASSSAAKELQQLQKEVTATQQQLTEAEQQMQQHKAVEKEIEVKLDNAKAQMQVTMQRYALHVPRLGVFDQLPATVHSR